MTTANLQNCKRLYELSGWDDTEKYWQQWYSKYHDSGLAPWQIATRAQAQDDYSKSLTNHPYPAYDSGYLLRKLPGIELYDVINLWEARSSGFNQVADTPEDALALLAIKLIEEKVITV